MFSNHCRGGTISAPCYTAAGVRVGGEIPVPVATENDQEAETIIALDDGRFAVFWEDGSESSSFPAPKFRIFNADGSEVQQCGNGARCVAAWLVREGSAPRADFIIDSPAGEHAVRWIDDGHFEVDMGAPRFAPA